MVCDKLGNEFSSVLHQTYTVLLVIQTQPLTKTNTLMSEIRVEGFTCVHEQWLHLNSTPLVTNPYDMVLWCFYHTPNTELSVIQTQTLNNTNPHQVRYQGCRLFLYFLISPLTGCCQQLVVIKCEIRNKKIIKAQFEKYVVTIFHELAISIM